MRIPLTLFFSLTTLAYAYSQETPEKKKFELVSLTREVNTRYHDSAPLVSPDGKVLYFTVNDHPENTQGKGSQDIWYTELDEHGHWAQAKHMPAPLNQNKFNQALSLSPDGNTLFIRGGKSRDEKGFSLCQRINGVWQKPIPQDIDGFEKMCKGRFNGAFLSRDSKVMLLYFNESENANYSDLYVSFLQGTNKWTKPKLIDGLNTRLDEFGPYLAPDNKTLYFASNRPGGFGSADIYKTTRLDDTWFNWSTPENIGEPVNTGGFDAYYAIGNADTLVFTTRAHMSADGGHLDIYTLQRIIEKKAKINLVVMASDLKTGDVIANAGVTILQDTDSLSLSDTDPAEENFETQLPAPGYYYVNAKAEGYFAGKDSLAIPFVQEDTTIYKTLFLKPLEVGVSVRLNNIFFDFDKTVLRPESYPELDKVVTLLKENPGLYIEIGGHTDDKGSDDYNEELSQGRAEAVRSYITSNWIAAERVTAKGYGESKPEVPNDNDDNRQINRRVEFTILKNGEKFISSEKNFN